MIDFKIGDIFNSNCNVLVNPVNLEGEMNNGLALRFKEKYPGMFKSYEKICKAKRFFMGEIQLIKVEKNKFVLNFPTSIYSNTPSSVDYIDMGLKRFVQTYKKLGIKSIAFPKLGCGEVGNLKWFEIKRMMVKYLSALPITIEIYE